MLRGLKTSAAFAVALAISVISVSPAQAASSLDVEAAPAIITGSQVTQTKFILGESGTSLTCTTATLKGTTTATNVTTVAFVPFYGTPSEKTCKLGGLSASVEVGSCEFTFTSTATALTFNADIFNCGVGFITIKNVTCTVTIPNQVGLASLTFQNEGTGSTADVLETAKLGGIAYTGGSGCPVNVVGNHIDGKLTGTHTLQAFKDVGGVEGAQVSLRAT